MSECILLGMSEMDEVNLLNHRVSIQGNISDRFIQFNVIRLGWVGMPARASAIIMVEPGLYTISKS